MRDAAWRGVAWRGEARRGAANDERTDVHTFGIFASRRATPVVSLSYIRTGPNELNFDDRAYDGERPTFITEKTIT